MMADTSLAAPAAPVPLRTVLVSAIGVWAVYFVLVTLRSAVVDSEGFVEMMGRRAIVSAAGVAATLMIWLVLRRCDAQPLWVRIAAILLLASPAALALAYVNQQVFSSMDKDWVLDDGQTRVVINSKGDVIVDAPGAGRTVLRDPKDEGGHSIWKELTDIAFGRYFLLLAWGALYLALANAERVRAAERRAAGFERAAKAAELRSLRYQVNPHFLFNTLNSLSALVMTGRRDDAEAMIQTLASFYRASLTDSPTMDVRLSEEVALQRHYLEIEAIRFPGRLLTRFEIPAELDNVCVPGLILQPLIENAVKHGVAPVARPVTILIGAKIVAGQLQILVSDDGAGGDPQADGMGIGLTNVRERLAARFGLDASVEAAPVNPGYAVRLIMPVVRSGC